jgi:hypothetical protein
MNAADIRNPRGTGYVAGQQSSGEHFMADSTSNGIASSGSGALCIHH